MTSADAPGGPTISPLRGGQKLLFLLGAVLLWPALLHGDVYAFNDTVSYLRGADTIFAKLTGEHAAFFAAPPGPNAAEAATATAGETMVLYGRSLYFGLFLYLGLLLGSFWVPVVLQTATAGAVIVGAVRHFVEPADERAFLRACLAAFALVACTPLPFFACFLMPDLVVALGLLAAALLLCGWRRERRGWRVALLAVLAFAALSHSTAVAVFALLGLGGLLAAWRAGSRAVALAAGGVLMAALLGIAGEAAFGLASRLTTGADPVRPPFLTARLIEDGPARRFLAERCHGAEFALCRYPVAGDVTAEIFLWEPTRPRGGFKALPPTDARAVAQEQARFALAVARAYPVDTASALAGDFVALATTVRLHDFRPEFLAGRMHADRTFEAVPGRLPLVDRVVSAITWVLLVASLAALLWLMRAEPGRRLKALVLTGFAAIMLNDMICGWLSGPFARYHTRVIWMLPLLVLLLAMAQAMASAAGRRQQAQP